MNILPKKRWHVRTKENIARVRKDEAEAAAKEKEEQSRIENADREARLNVLKLRAKQKLQEHGDVLQEHGDVLEKPGTSDTDSFSAQREHVNLFSDVERCTTGTNKEHELEAKNKKEEYEKQIGYLTYLGQDTNEALGKKNWYEVAPESARFARPDHVKETYTKLTLRDADGKPRPATTDTRHGEVSWKAKQAIDPINAFRHLSHKVKSKLSTAEKPSKDKSETEENEAEGHKRHKKRNKQDKESSRKDKAEKLRMLREARLRRELAERRKARALLATVSGDPPPPPTDRPLTARLKPKYNSQFNPELARQNYT